MPKPTQNREGTDTAAVTADDTITDSVGSEASFDSDAVRQKLNCVAWVQCDNSHCLKWRKVKSCVADALTEESIWTCDMNEDHMHQNCSAPEEDVAQFDRLAKKAKLDLIRSELKPGQLVWAKTIGYCRWPALITADPEGAGHVDNDDYEALSYHVEYLGGQRSHCWVSAKTVEVFGPGNLSVEKESQSSKKTSTRGRKKSSAKQKWNGYSSYQRKRKEKTSYGGKCTVEKAVKEALDLMEKSVDERLATVRFAVKLSKTQATDSQPRCSQISSIPSCASIAIKENSPPAHRRHHSKNSKSVESRTTRRGKLVKKLQKAREHAEALVPDIEPENSPRMKSFDFNTSLIDVSKEERFMLDIEEYKRNKKGFEHDLTRFRLRHGMKVCSSVMWNNITVNLFSLFLAVHERGGFDKVCKNRQWAQIYAELAEQINKCGGTRAKKFYEQHLYLYELYVSGKDWIEPYLRTQDGGQGRKIAAKRKQKQIKALTLSQDEGIASTESGSSFDAPEVLDKLKDLEDVLHTVMGDESDEHIVPVADNPRALRRDILSTMHDPLTSPTRASWLGAAIDPEESGQVVPEQELTSSEEDSVQYGDDRQLNQAIIDGGEWHGDGDGQADQASSEGGLILHELQNLDHAMVHMQEEIDLL